LPATSRDLSTGTPSGAASVALPSGAVELFFRLSRRRSLQRCERRAAHVIRALAVGCHRVVHVAACHPHEERISLKKRDGFTVYGREFQIGAVRQICLARPAPDGGGAAYG
jgi:hypothetical protein